MVYDYNNPMPKILWTPQTTRRKDSQLAAFASCINAEHKLNLKTEGKDAFDKLHQWSVQNPRHFWRAVWEFCAVTGEPGKNALIREKQLPGARFFPGGKFNFAENILNFGGADNDTKTAIIALRENGARNIVTRAELKKQTMQLAAWLRKQGVRKGDRVAAYMPNCPQTVIAMLATTTIGAVFSSCSIDFGADGVIDRFGQIKPKILFAADGYSYKNKNITRAPEIKKVLRALPSIKKLVLLPYSQTPAKIKGAVSWQSAANSNTPARNFAETKFNDPSFVLYSSGTTGKPKCIVHSGGGVMLQHLKEHRLHADIRADDVFFYFTTCGWMMWNWLVSGLASGATIVLYEGDPFYPSPAKLWDIAAREKINHFGASAKYIDALRAANFKPDKPLPHLRAMYSTGSPLSADAFDYVYGNIKKDVQLASISGGTDIVSCFVLGNPWQPVRRGEIQGAGLGMAADVFGENGKPLRDKAGELVCTNAFPCMPLGFWNDKRNLKYRAAYFGKYKNIWRHGDWASRNKQTGGFVIYGRSDATLNPGGVRIGTAELYRPVEALSEINEAIAVGQRSKDGERVVLFVKLARGKVLNETLRAKIKTAIRKSASPRHVPAKIVAVADIPRTRSGKISEIVVRDIIHGIAPKNRTALANPESLSLFANIPELQD